MKRPLLTIGLSWLCATAGLVLLGSEALAVLPALAACLFAAALWFPSPIRNYGCTAALSVLAACGVFWLHTAWVLAPLQQLAGQTLTFRGTVVAVRPAGQATAYDLYGSFVQEDAPARRFTLPVLALGETEVAVGDKLEGSFALQLPDEAEEQKKLLAYGQVLQALQGDVQPAVMPPPTGVVVWGALLRESLLKALEESIPGTEGGLVASMLLSESMAVDPAVTAQMRRTGAAHVLVVSGFHLSVIVKLISGLAAALGWNRRVSGLAAAACCVAVMAVVGFTPSILRSGIMMLLWLLGQQLGRRSDSLTSLAFAALVMLLCNPYVLLSMGFQLSFAAVLSIALFATPLRRFLTRRLTDRGKKPGKTAAFVLSALSVTLGASVLTYPVLAAAFGVLPTYGILGNLLITPLVPVILAFGAAAALLQLAGLGLAAGWAGWAAGTAARLVAHIAALLAALPLGWLPITQGYQLLWLFGAAGVLIGLAALRPNYRVCLFVLTGLLLPLLLGMLSWSVWAGDSVRLVTWDEHGSLALLRGDTAVVVGVSAQKGHKGAQQLAASLEELGAVHIHLLLDDGSTSPMARSVAQIQQLGPAAAVLPGAKLEQAEPYLPSQTTGWPREHLQLEVLGGIAVQPSDRGLTLITIGHTKILKLSQGYDIITSNDPWSMVDVVVSPKGDFVVLNPDIRVRRDLAGRRTIQLRITDEM